MRSPGSYQHRFLGKVAAMVHRHREKAGGNEHGLYIQGVGYDALQKMGLCLAEEAEEREGLETGGGKCLCNLLV